MENVVVDNIIYITTVSLISLDFYIELYKLLQKLKSNQVEKDPQDVGVSAAFLVRFSSFCAYLLCVILSSCTYIFGIEQLLLPSCLLSVSLSFYDYLKFLLKLFHDFWIRSYN